MPCARICEVASATTIATTEVIAGTYPSAYQNTHMPAAPDPSSAIPSLSLIERSGSRGRGSRSR